jgi:long-chain fatty acid transport protein
MRILQANATICALAIVHAGLLHCSEADAAGFALNEMSAAAIGGAFAGAGATAEDISTIYYNPAGLSRMAGRQFMVSGSLVRPSVRFDNQGSLSAARTTMRGGNGGDAGDLSLVPALYFATDLVSGWRFGIGLQSPFGLKTDYEADWAGRYQALRSELKTVNINPTLSYALSESLSLGMGISAQYAKVELSRAIDFGSACIGALGPTTCARAGFLPQAKDGKVTLDGSDWAFGFNLGLLYAPTQATRFGLAYRSHIRHELSGGEARFDKPAGLPAPLAAAASFSDTSARAGLDLPETVNLSAYTELDSRWAVMGDINWTRWSRFNELRIRFDNGAPDSVVPEQWRNVIRVGLGASYRYSDAWKLRGGISYEQSPVKDAFRTPSVPDAARKLVAVGVQYKPSPRTAWDLGYAHVFIKDAAISRADPPLGGTLTGSYDNNVNILSIQFTQAF